MKLINLKILGIFWIYLLWFSVAAPVTESIRLIFRPTLKDIVHTGNILQAPRNFQPCKTGTVRVSHKKCRKIVDF